MSFVGMFCKEDSLGDNSPNCPFKIYKNWIFITVQYSCMLSDKKKKGKERKPGEAHILLFLPVNTGGNQNESGKICIK